MIHAVASDRNQKVEDFLKKFNIRNTIAYVSESWKAIKESSMNGVWQKLWPERVE